MRIEFFYCVGLLPLLCRLVFFWFVDLVGVNLLATLEAVLLFQKSLSFFYLLSFPWSFLKCAHGAHRDGSCPHDALKKRGFPAQGSAFRTGCQFPSFLSFWYVSFQWHAGVSASVTFLSWPYFQILNFHLFVLQIVFSKYFREFVPAATLLLKCSLSDPLQGNPNFFVSVC